MPIDVRRRRVLIAALAGAGLAALGITVASSRAAGGPVELTTSNVTPAGKLTALRAGSVYRASTFPVALRMTAPDGGWGGAQWRTTSYGKPAFGWVAVARAPFEKPRGAIEIVTAFGPTPSVAATMARVRSEGSGATFGKPTPITLAGYTGTQIDGSVFGKWGHMFVPLTPRTGGASPTDSWRLEQGEAFRILVLDVRGKTVVLLLDSVALPAADFPSFLTQAERLLRALRFPPS